MGKGRHSNLVALWRRNGIDLGTSQIGRDPGSRQKVAGDHSTSGFRQVDS
jgi:hypothetical protein